MDDILDFTQSTEQLGKPQGQDLASGNLTAPAIFALQNPDVAPELLSIIEVRPWDCLVGVLSAIGCAQGSKVCLLAAFLYGCWVCTWVWCLQ